MKNLILLALLMPTMAFAQSEQSAETPSRSYAKNEIAFKAGTSKDVIDNRIPRVASAVTSLSYYRNFEFLQVGLSLEAGITPYNYSFFSPVLSGNYLFRFDKSYAYAGIAAGYIISQDNESFFNTREAKGYMMGAQAGYVYNIGKHFALNAEVGLRNYFEWYETDIIYTDNLGNSITIPYKDLLNRLDVPVTLGLRYRF